MKTLISLAISFILIIITRILDIYLLQHGINWTYIIAYTTGLIDLFLTAIAFAYYDAKKE